LLLENLSLLGGYLARPVCDVRPPVPEVSKSRHFAAVVAPHVSPLLTRRIVPESPIELDVHAVLADEHVEVFRAVAKAAPLSLALREAMSPTQARVANLEW